MPWYTDSRPVPDPSRLGIVTVTFPLLPKSTMEVLLGSTEAGTKSSVQRKLKPVISSGAERVNANKKRGDMQYLKFVVQPQNHFFGFVLTSNCVKTQVRVIKK